MKISIIIPVLDEAADIADVLAALAPYRARGSEVVVVDGGSGDATQAIAAPLADRLIDAPRGRAMQMNAGARASSGDVLVFLHADTRLPDGADRLVLEGLAASGRTWGRFDVEIRGRNAWLPVIARFMNLRSRLTGIATGDQAMFVRRDAFERAGGFPAIVLMEDVAFSAALKRFSPPLCLRAKAATSGRRWENRGVVRTIALMWYLRLRFFLGAEPARLAERYGAERSAR